MKAEMLLFPNPVSGGPRGDLATQNFHLSYDFEPKKFNIEKDFKLKFTLPKSPRGPPDTGFGKSNISAFTGKKFNVVKFLDQFLVHFEKGQQNPPQNLDTRWPTRN